MKNKLYDERILKGIQNISMLCALFLSIIEFENVHTNSILSNFKSFRIFLENLVTIITFVILSIYPHKIGFLVIPSFLYAFSCSIWDKDNSLGVCMFFLGNVILYTRGFFQIQRKNKISLILLAYVTSILSEVRFGKDIFLSSLINKCAYSLVLSIMLFLIITHLKTLESDKPKILNLAEFPDLRKDDVILLQEVLGNKQYKEIASDVFRAEGTVRNRLNKVYDILGVMDRMGFLSTYMGYNIVFEEEKNKDLEDKKDGLFPSIKKKKKKK